MNSKIRRLVADHYSVTSARRHDGRNAFKVSLHSTKIFAYDGRVETRKPICFSLTHFFDEISQFVDAYIVPNIVSIPIRCVDAFRVRSDHILFDASNAILSCNKIQKGQLQPSIPRIVMFCGIRRGRDCRVDTSNSVGPQNAGAASRVTEKYSRPAEFFRFFNLFQVAKNLKNVSLKDFPHVYMSPTASTINLRPVLHISNLSGEVGN